MKSNDPDKLCDVVVEESLELWKKDESNIDDITIVTVFIKA